ncbi:MAG: PilZ domain-containing protein [Proteobacteria bacterium]|nr:PilZ domain-containing protein [Pseudomonadota bacterium]
MILNDTSQESKRNAERISPFERIKVLNLINDTIIGQIVNISQTGLMLASRSQIFDKQILQTYFNIGGKPILVGLECSWSDQQKSGMTIAGFLIIDISTKDKQILKQYIDSCTD